MAYYYNPNFEASPETNSGPYTFKHGLIQTTDDNDDVVGQILQNFYGCEKVEKAKVKEIMTKYKTTAAPAAEASAEAEATK